MTFTQYVHDHLTYFNSVSDAVLIWVLTQYAYPNQKQVQTFKIWNTELWAAKRLAIPAARSLAGALLTYLVLGHSITIALYSLACGVIFFWARTFIEARWLAETELVGNAIFIAGVCMLARHLGVPPDTETPLAQFDPGHLVAIKFIIAIALYMVGGGTMIVRGLLEKGRILPQSQEAADDKRLDEVEYNHGRMIGNIERLLLLALVAIQAYGALGFLMAAKGLVRAKELEDRSFAEYFLFGTLVSSGTAVAAGLLIQLVIKLCW